MGVSRDSYNKNSMKIAANPNNRAKPITSVKVVTNTAGFIRRWRSSVTVCVRPMPPCPATTGRKAANATTLAMVASNSPMMPPP